METVGGLPCLTDDLTWKEDMPFFVTGRLAGLRLGPGAGNLEGARMGAERVAWKIGEFVRAGAGEEVEAEETGGAKGGQQKKKGVVDMRCLGLGWENQFGALGQVAV